MLCSVPWCQVSYFVLQPSPPFIHRHIFILQTGSSTSIKHQLHPLLPVLRDHVLLRFHEFPFFRTLYQCNRNSVYPFVRLISLSTMSSGLIHAVSWIRISNLIKVGSYSTVWIMLYFVYPIHLLMGTWVASTFWLMWTMLLRTKVYKSLSFCFWFFWVSTQKQNCCLIFWGTAILFSITLHHFMFSQDWQLLHILANTFCFVFM